MSKNNFTRSNVNEQTLMISEINRSGFDLSHRVNTTLKLGRLTPVNIERLLPTDIVQGSLFPKFQLENCGTPTIGKLRLDTHTFQVNLRRIHKNFRSFMEDNSNNTVLPSFSIPVLLYNYIAVIVNYGATGSFPSSPYAANSTIISFGATGSETSIPDVATNILTAFKKGLYDLCADTSSEYGWNKDFLALEWKRLNTIIVPNDATAIGYVLYQIILSIAGEGSIFDLLGYPIYNRLGAWYAAVTNEDIPLSTWLSAELSKIMTLCFVSSPSGTWRDYIPVERYSEMPLRAIYAIYYDYFRDWHVEPRESVLNPDNFDSTSLISWQAGAMKESFSVILQLLVLRFRNFSRDFLTTVQVDDIYRHVYAPILPDSSLSQVVINPNQPSSSIVQSALDLNNVSMGENLVNIMRGIVENVPFLGDWIYSSSSSQSSPNVSADGFIADLQTMRRSGMLEKWLARNYFYPDTYAGQIRAHYNIVPDDINYINAQYLGGTEQLVDGSQTIAPVDTPQMDAGTRTVVSGVNASDSFSYRASDHCYIISFVSLMPIVNYDIKNMHLKELRKMDIASPEFAQDSRVAIRLKDMLRGFDDNDEVLGYVPRYYQYRVHGDETHGRYLNDYRSYSWFRDWYNMNFVDLANINIHGNQEPRGFVLSPYCLRVHLSLDAFNDKLPWDDIAFGSCDIQFFKNSPLPGAVDII